MSSGDNQTGFVQIGNYSKEAFLSGDKGLTNLYSSYEFNLGHAVSVTDVKMGGGSQVTNLQFDSKKVVFDPSFPGIHLTPSDFVKVG